MSLRDDELEDWCVWVVSAIGEDCSQGLWIRGLDLCVYLLVYLPEVSLRVSVMHASSSSNPFNWSWEKRGEDTQGDKRRHKGTRHKK